MVKVRVPASTSNLGSGFDTFGLALQLYLTVEIDTISQGLEIHASGEGAADIPSDERNLVFSAIKKISQISKKRLPGLKIYSINEIPLLRGLGSSGAAIAAGLVAGKHLFGLSVSIDELLSIGTGMDGHPDNVSASLNGGLVINATDKGAVITKKVPVDEKLRCVFMVPDNAISTKTARQILPEKILLADAIYNVQRSALLVQAILERDYGNLKTAMQDRLHHPYRKHLIRWYDEFEKCGYENGALGISISGSGSAILGITCQDTERLSNAWTNKAKDLRLNAKVMVVGCDNTGAVIEA
ncbi:MAG: homoserine kinase [bacterium]